jgi:hypothetical protein
MADYDVRRSSNRRRPAMAPKKSVKKRSKKKLPVKGKKKAK